MRRFLGSAAILLLLVGCTAPDVGSSTPPDDSGFGTEAEAVAAAESLWASYLAATSEVSAAGGQDLAPFDGMVTERMRDDLERIAASFAEHGLRTEGDYAFTDFTADEVRRDEDGTRIHATACIDQSAVRYLDESGAEIVPPAQFLHVQTELEFVSVEGDPTALLLERATPEPDGELCG